MDSYAQAVVALVIGAAAAASDLATRRIPNLLTLGSAMLGFVFFLVTRGLDGLGWSLAGWGVGCALFLPLFLLRGMGAGDVKLLAALGAWVGPITVLWVAAFGAMAGGVLAVGISLAHGYLRPAIGNLGRMLGYWTLFGPKPVPDMTLADAKGPRLAYAVPISIGLAAALWFH